MLPTANVIANVCSDTAGLVRFWIGSQNQKGEGLPHQDGVFEPGFGHFANGTRGQPGPVAYSSWILAASVKAAAVQGDFSLGQDFHGRPVVFGDLLVDMVEWWEQRTLQLRTDCIIMNGDHQGNPADMNRTCLDLPPTPGVPYCYTMADGWDAMEGSVSGNGCRPAIGAMMWAEALAIATVANSTGRNASLATKFQRRAEWVRAWYLDHLWSEKSKFLAVYKQGAEFTGMGGCTDNTRKNLTDGGCCCLKPGTRARTGHYANFSMCPPESVCHGCMCGHTVRITDLFLEYGEDVFVMCVVGSGDFWMVQCQKSGTINAVCIYTSIQISANMYYLFL